MYGGPQKCLHWSFVGRHASNVENHWLRLSGVASVLPKKVFYLSSTKKLIWPSRGVLLSVKHFENLTPSISNKTCTTKSTYFFIEGEQLEYYNESDFFGKIGS